MRAISVVVKCVHGSGKRYDNGVDGGAFAMCCIHTFVECIHIFSLFFGNRVFDMERHKTEPETFFVLRGLQAGSNFYAALISGCFQSTSRKVGPALL